MEKLKVPVDKEGFFKAFDVKESKEILMEVHWIS